MCQLSSLIRLTQRLGKKWGKDHPTVVQRAHDGTSYEVSVMLELDMYGLTRLGDRDNLWSMSRPGQRRVMVSR